MEMIIGGAFQGKSDYAKEKHPEICWKNGGKLEEYQLMKAEGVLDFQEFIRKELKASFPWTLLTGNTGKQWAESVRDLLPKAKK